MELAEPSAWDRLGPYEVLGSIAEGGMGIVLRGRDTRDGREVAIKTVRSPESADATGIRREIQVLGQLSHPGIVRLIADWTSNQMPWMAMELLQGHTVCDEIAGVWGLDDPRQPDEVPTVRARVRPVRRHAARRIAMTHPWPAAAGRLRKVLSIAMQLCETLDHIHALGLVHRDVKPANVFLGDGDRVTLLDFGLACAVQGLPVACEPAPICVGTMEYAAPEQIRGKVTDTRADIFSLGCMLYELVTGQRPVQADSPSEVVERQLLRDPPAPSQLVSGVPGALDSLLLAMMAKRPGDRPVTAGVAKELCGIVLTLP